VDGWLTNFQVRWMCDEDRGFILVSRKGVASLAIPDEVARRDRGRWRCSAAGIRASSLRPASEGEAAYALAERWPSHYPQVLGFGVERTELSVVDRKDANRVLATASLYRRVEQGPTTWRAVRDALVPPPERCAASDRVDFVTRALVPAPQ